MCAQHLFLFKWSHMIFFKVVTRFCTWLFSSMNVCRFFTICICRPSKRISRASRATNSRFILVTTIALATAASWYSLRVRLKRLMISTFSATCTIRNVSRFLDACLVIGTTTLSTFTWDTRLKKNTHAWSLSLSITSVSFKSSAIAASRRLRFRRRLSFFLLEASSLSRPCRRLPF